MGYVLSPIAPTVTPDNLNTAPPKRQTIIGAQPFSFLSTSLATCEELKQLRKLSQNEKKKTRENLPRNYLMFGRKAPNNEAQKSFLNILFQFSTVII